MILYAAVVKPVQVSHNPDSLANTLNEVETDEEYRKFLHRLGWICVYTVVLVTIVVLIVKLVPGL